MSDAGALLAGTLIAQTATAGSYLLAVRQLTPAEAGPMLVAMAVAVWAASASDLGVNSYLVRGLVDDDGGGVFRSSLALRLLLAVLLLVGFAVIPWLGGGDANLLLMAGVFAAGSVMARTVEVVFRVRGPIALWVGMPAVERLGGLGVMGALVALGTADNPWALPASSSAAVLVVALLGWVLLPRSLRIPDLAHPLQAIRLARRGLPFYVRAMSTQLQRLDVLAVGAVAGSAAAGLYGAPMRLRNLLSAPTNALSATVFSHLTLGSPEMPERRKDARRAILLLPLISFIPLAAVFVAADELVRIGLGSQYGPSAIVLRLLVLSLPFGMVARPASSWLMAERDDRFTASVTAIVWTAGLAGVGVGAQVAGIEGAGAAVVVTQAVLALVFGLRVRHLRHDEP